MKLSSHTLKIIAIIAMTIDHIAFVFVPTHTILYAVMRIIGRLTFPIMAYMLVKGFHHTKNRRKYLSRMAVFAVISQPFYWLMAGGGLRLNVLFTLSVALIMLMIIESRRLNSISKAVLILGFIGVSFICDWSWIGLLLVFVYYKFRDNAEARITMFFFISTLACFWYGGLQLGILLALIPLSMYSGERGGSSKPLNKWFFYGFYAAHMAALVAVKFLFQI